MSRTRQHGAVLITGTSSGIGKVTALHMDRLGFRVFAAVRKQADADALSSQASERLCPIFLDVTDEASINVARDEVAQSIEQDGLIGLVNNAAVGFTSPLEFVPLKDLRWLFEVNVFGVLAVTQAFLPLLRQARGRIVNVSSTASLVVAPFHGPYSASKLSLNGLSNALRLELRPQGLQVSVVVCGSIKTPMWEKGSDLSRQVSQNYPPQAWQLYGSRYGKLRDYFSRVGRSGVPPEAAARAIVHSLTAKRARNTYFVGPDARLYNVANKLLYGRLRDWVIMRGIGLNDNA